MSLDYIELNCIINPYLQKNIDLLIAFLSEKGYESFMETDIGFLAYIPADQFDESIIKKLQDQKFEFKLKVSYTVIKDQNWNETWTEHYFQPIVFGNDLVVRASFHTDYPKAKKEIIMDPKNAFGTGNHGTTYMLTEEILKTDLKGKSVLDMGCGTGILAILSKMKDSGYTLAVDNDPKAVINTKENCSINKTPGIELKEGDISVLREERFDIIYENIWKNIVINDLPILENRLKPGGIILVSGFYFKEFEEVKKAGEEAGLIFSEVKERDEWAMIKFKKA
jgi:ribosomal protein L11 methyltransferase